MTTTDTRIVYGARCSWWDSIDKVAASASGLPICPHCGSPLFEQPGEEAWWAGVREHEASGNPGYERFVRWLRGRCFPNFDFARHRYDHLTGRPPYVGDGTDGARRSAQIDQDEIDGLDRHDPRRPELEASRDAWLTLAGLLPAGGDR